MVIHEIIHIILSGIVALVGYRYFKSIWVWIASFAAGFFVDADHLIDYFHYRGVLAFNPVDFATGDYFDKAGKIFLLLHSYEIAIILTLIAMVFWIKSKKNHLKTIVILLVIASSLTFHLIYDTLYYKPDWNTYFLLSRVTHDFNITDFHFH